jgi:hypothetical protein
MGLLDDAIKEHLELKRKHGAAEEEVMRQEAEALGPARRDFASQAPAAEAAVPAEAPAEPEVAAQPASWLDDEETVAPEPEPVEAPPPAPPTQVLPTPPPEPVLREEPAPLRPEPPAPVEQRESDTPTQGFPAISRDEPLPDVLPEEDDEEEDEDVLEETPEFLQDTPEHDRLWFEQKPPRDFDFDG